MGYDLFGLEPKSARGRYFRNNIWFWHRLWDFVCEISKDILTEDEKRRGHFNEGLEIDKERTETIARRLQEALLQKDLYEEQIAERAGKVGTGHQQLAQVVQKICAKIGAEFEPRNCTQRFSWGNVREFAVFCQECGGFRIC